MRIVVDGLPIRSSSLAIVVEQLLAGWQRLNHDDAIHLVVGPDADLAVPQKVTVHRLAFAQRSTLSRLLAQNIELPKLCRTLEADILLAALPTTAVCPLPCPRAVIVHDLRHELRPAQFSAKARMLRRIGYGVGLRQAEAVICVSERTRNDLLRSRPWMRGRVVRVALHGSDHVLSWRRQAGNRQPFALAFGQYENKNVDLVVDAWSILKHRDVDLPLVLVGLPVASRRCVEERVAELELKGSVTTLPWLTTAEFHELFLSARMVVLPSDLEGFGLPAIEAMRLGIPVVVSADPALLEVTGGHATVVDGQGPAALADAVMAASSASRERVEAARAHAETFTWERSARTVRLALLEIVDRR